MGRLRLHVIRRCGGSGARSLADMSFPWGTRERYVRVFYPRIFTSSLVSIPRERYETLSRLRKLLIKKLCKMLAVIIISLLVALIIWWVVLNAFRLPNINGPFIARYTDLWRLVKVHQGDMHNVYLDLHKNYGNLVRVGPNCVSVSGPEALAAVYNISEKLPKV